MNEPGNQQTNLKETETMTTQIREKSTGLDLLYAGLGTVAGVAVVLTVQMLWQGYAGGAQDAAASITALSCRSSRGQTYRSSTRWRT